MTYFNQLLAFNNTHFNLLDLDIANELLAISNKKLIELNSDKNAQEEFNKACGLIKSAYLEVDCDISLSSVVNAFIEAMEENESDISRIDEDLIIQKIY